jgi:hypothetical protein
MRRSRALVLSATVVCVSLFSAGAAQAQFPR